MNDDRLPATGISSSSQPEDAIRVLHVDDDPALGDLVATWLEREHDALTVVTATSAAEGLDRLAEEPIDCIVSDYDMPDSDGLEFLRQIRETRTELPFILYTGRGSEEIASKAISAGVTDYLQKGSGTDQYTVLVNRIENAVSKYRAQHAVEETQERFRKLIQHSTDVISIVDADGQWQYLTPSAKRVLGYEPGELIGDIGFEHVHPDDRAEAIEKFANAIEDPDYIPTVKFRFDHPDGWIWLENRARNLVDDSAINGFVVHTRDVTQRTQREQELTRQNERLEEVVNTVAHDLRNPLNVAEGCLELARETGDDDHFDRVEQAHDRANQIIDDLITLAREGERVTDLQPVGFETIVADAWSTVETNAAKLHCDGTETLLVDQSRYQRLLENMFRNAVEHGGADVSVWASTVDGGFYVEDNGPGITADDSERVFESGYSTNDGGTGFGLSIVKQIVEAHGWEISVTDGRDGGARFEITGVEFV